jgi:hypothetical protein
VSERRRRLPASPQDSLGLVRGKLASPVRAPSLRGDRLISPAQCKQVLPGLRLNEARHVVTVTRHDTRRYDLLGHIDHPLGDARSVTDNASRAALSNLRDVRRQCSARRERFLNGSPERRLSTRECRCLYAASENDRAPSAGSTGEPSTPVRDR